MLCVVCVHIAPFSPSDVLVLLNGGCHSLPKHIHNLARLGTLVPSRSGRSIRTQPLTHEIFISTESRAGMRQVGQVGLGLVVP